MPDVVLSIVHILIHLILSKQELDTIGINSILQIT